VTYDAAVSTQTGLLTELRARLCASPFLKNFPGVQALLCPQTTTPGGLAVSISVAPTSAAVGENLTLTASATGGTAPYTFDWNFGDGTTSSGNVNPAIHAYATSGEFQVSVQVTDSQNNTATGTATVTVSGTAISLNISPTSIGAGGGTVTISGTTNFPDGTIVALYQNGTLWNNLLVADGGFGAEIQIPINSSTASKTWSYSAETSGVSSNTVQVTQAGVSTSGGPSVSTSGVTNSTGTACEAVVGGIVNHGLFVTRKGTVMVTGGTAPYSWIISLNNGLQGVSGNGAGSSTASSFSASIEYCDAYYGEAAGGTVVVTDASGNSGSASF
jgi:hypothetical protein